MAHGPFGQVVLTNCLGCSVDAPEKLGTWERACVKLKTTLTRTTAGPALRVNTKSASNPPLATNGKGKVTNLNADAVDGLDSSALRTRSYVFTKVTGSVPEISVDVLVPAGTYLFDYSAFLQGSANSSVYCEIARVHNSSSSYVGISQFGAAGAAPGLTGSGVVVKAPGDTITFQCGSTNTFFTTADIPIQLVMTPTKVVANGSLRTAARGSARVAGR
jgi:hypothetical protein